MTPNGLTSHHISPNNPQPRVSSFPSLMATVLTLPCALLRLGLAGYAAHNVTVFYAKQFRWQDLRENGQLRYYQRPTTILKTFLAFACFIVRIQLRFGAPIIVVLAIPQLFRKRGKASQQVRSILGPMTPLISFNMFAFEQSIATAALTGVSFVAFAIFRPDNSAVLDLVLPRRALPAFGFRKRRQIHGRLKSR